MNERQQVDSHGDIPIYLESGWFYAYINESKLRARTLARLKRLISQNIDAMHAIARRSWVEFDVPEEVYVNKDGTRWRNARTGFLVDKYLSLYEYDSDLLNEFIEFDRDYRALSERYRKLANRLVDLQVKK